MIKVIVHVLFQACYVVCPIKSELYLHHNFIPPTPQQHTIDQTRTPETTETQPGLLRSSLYLGMTEAGRQEVESVVRLKPPLLTGRKTGLGLTTVL